MRYLLIHNKRNNRTKASQEEEQLDDNDSQEDQLDDNDNRGITSIITSNEMLKVGLKTGGYTSRRLNRAKKATNIERFKSLYGSSPRVVALIWEDLQTTQVDNAHVVPKDRKVKFFLMALHHLKRYPTEYERERLFDMNIGWSRDWCWFFVEKIQALNISKESYIHSQIIFITYKYYIPTCKNDVEEGEKGVD